MVPFQFNNTMRSISYLIWSALICFLLKFNVSIHFIFNSTTYTWQPVPFCFPIWQPKLSNPLPKRSDLFPIQTWCNVQWSDSFMQTDPSPFWFDAIRHASFSNNTIENNPILVQFDMARLLFRFDDAKQAISPIVFPSWSVYFSNATKRFERSNPNHLISFSIRFELFLFRFNDTKWNCIQYWISLMLRLDMFPSDLAFNHATIWYNVTK